MDEQRAKIPLKSIFALALQCGHFKTEKAFIYFDGQGVCTLPINFAYCGVMVLFSDFYHKLVNSVRVSALCYQLVS